MLLGRDHGAAGAHVGLRLGIARDRLLEPLPRAGFGLRQRLLALLLLLGLDLHGFGRQPRGLRLRDRRILQLDLVGQIVEHGLRGGDRRFGLRDLRLIIGGIDLDQEIAGLDALEVGDPDGQHFAGDAACKPRQLGAHIGVVGGLDHGIADPFVEAQRRQRDEGERDDHGEQRDREPAPE